MMKTHTRALASAGAVIGLALACSVSAEAQERVKWKMQSAFASSLSHLGTSGVRYTEVIDRLSAGAFEIKFYEPGALVPALECFDAASKGSVESCWTTPGYHTGKYPALAFFTAVPFGPSYGEFFAWKKFGGGDELKNEIYAQHGLYSIDVFAIGPETSGWFKEQVGSLDDLRGLKMRFFGLGAQVMQKLGVSTQLLAGADIYPALERGVIDATEFSMPNMDIDLGFYPVAKFNYYPGGHQQSSIGELLMNKAAFEGLSDQNQAIREASCGWNIYVLYAETEAKNPAAMNKMLEEYGVTHVRWGDEELAAFEAAWNEVLAEQSAQDEDFKNIAESYAAFRKVYKTWGDAQALKPTYLSE
jgi:TRAP-type mannitol/chloroaromatic compound transport system substrate-binding protein